MVYSRSVGTRSLVKALALCAIGLSLVPASEARNDADAASTATQECGVSDGDKLVGIQAINDSKCANGGLGCYNDHCRFCKVLDTPNSSHLDTCLSHGVAFTSVVPVVATTGQCEVSSGDVAAGISAVTDSACLYGGLGCFNDHCRFCKVTETPQSTGFIACSTRDSSYSDPVTEAPATAVPTTTSPVTDASATTTTVTDTPVIDVPVTTVPDSVVDGTTEAPTTITINGSVAQPTCEVVPSEGDLAVGITIVTDASCAAGGLGCINDMCRFCKLKTTPLSDPYMDCALIDDAASVDTKPTATVAPSASETPIVVSTSTDIPDVTTEPVPTTATPDVTVPVATTTAPDASTEVPIYTSDPPTASSATDTVDIDENEDPTETSLDTDESDDSDVGDFTSTATSVAKTCNVIASAGDAAVGLSVATDASCSSGGLGCIDDICRFCKVTISIQSAPYMDCALIEGGSPKSEAPAASTTAPVDVTTETPDVTTSSSAVTTGSQSATDVPVVATGSDVTTDTPTVTPGFTSNASMDDTNAPVTIIGAVSGQGMCSLVAAAGDIAGGVHIATDVACSAGGIGCINDVCRFCKVEDTDKSATFVDCDLIPGFALVSDTTDTPTDTTTPAPTNAPVLPASCDLNATSGDAAVGIRVVTDSTCSGGGVGCINDVCRFCKIVTSIQSAAFVDCASIEDYAPETPAPTTAVTSTNAPVSQSVCTLTASEGDLAVGVSIAEDTTCGAGGMGCINNVCRFCQVTATTQSAAFVNCTTLLRYTPRSEAPVDTATTSSVSTTDAPVAQATCDIVVSTGDAAVGISITGDATCSTGGVGCISDACRFCKVKTTVQSAVFVECTSIAGFVTAAEAPAVTMTDSSTNAPVNTSVDTPAATCSLVVSEGDATVGINITADSTCRFGGVGCITDACRFCKVKTTDQSAAFVDCPLTTTSTTLVATDGSDDDWDGSDSSASESTNGDSEDSTLEDI